MYINSVLSFLGAWQKLQRKHQVELGELVQAIAVLDESGLSKQSRERFRPSKTISPSELSRAFRQKLEEKGWGRNVRIRPGESKSPPFLEIDFAKNEVVVELGLGKRAFVESTLFVVFPFFMRVRGFEIAVVFVPMASLHRKMPTGVSSFESIHGLFIELRPMPLKYPFVIVGFSSEETSIDVTELTSDLDIFLIDTVGYSLDEMILLGEAPNYDFKRQLPRNEKLAQEVCAFANLSGGGVILFGVDNSGSIHGMLKGTDLDDTQLRITNVIHNSCSPTPSFEFQIFDAPDAPAQSILVTRIYEVELKPCMTQEKVYVRSGPSARPAGPDEIRRLVLG